MAAPTSWIYQNVKYFRMDSAIWLYRELRIQSHNRNWKISSKCDILKIRDGGGRHLGMTKMLITSAWVERFPAM